MEKKEYILQVAIDLFFKIGFKVVTMDDIASEIGISKKTIYEKFHNKYTLVDQALDYFFDQIEETFTSGLQKKGNAIEKWWSILQEVNALAKINNHSSCSLQLQKYYPKIFVKVRERQWNIVKNKLKMLIEQGREETLFRVFETDMCIRMYYIAFIGLMNDDFYEETEYTAVELKERLLEFHIRSIATPKGIKELEKLL